MNLTHKTNHYDHSLKRGMATVGELYLKVGDLVWGLPKSTDEHSTEELELMGVYGIYEVVED